MSLTVEQYKGSMVLDRLTDQLMSLFVGRTDTYAEQNADGTYTRIDRPLTRTLILRHLRGEVTLGAYQLNEANMVKELAFDVDEDHVKDPKGATETIIEECTWKPSPETPRFWPQTVLLEASRHPDPSYHVRVLFEPEIKAAHAKWLGLKVFNYAGLSPSEVEVFPKQVELTPEKPYGNFVKLPLGFHRKEKKWSRFLDHASFEPLPSTVLLDAYGASFSEGDLARLDNLLQKERGAQMTLPIKSLPKDFRNLREGEEKEAAQLLAKYWVRGYRNRLEMAFLGWCLKNSVSYASAIRIIDAVATHCQDEEKPARLQLVKYHYENRRSLGSTLKGFTGLVEVIREVMGK